MAAGAVCSQRTNAAACGWRLAATRAIREALTIYQQAEDLIQLGGYVSGSNPRLDQSIQMRPSILNFLRQDSEVNVPREETLQGLANLAQKLNP